MDLTHYGHACVLADIPGPEGPVRVLFDPGAYSRDFEHLRDLDLILITHSHPDHLDAERLTTLLDDNLDAELVLGQDSVAALADPDRLDIPRHPRSHAVAPGDKLSLRGIEIEVVGGEHACIHSDLPVSANVGYVLNGSLFHPGDAFDVPSGSIDVLLLPAGGPWMKIGEGIDYLRAVAPRIAVPIHQAGLAPVHQNLHHGLLKSLAPADTEIVVLDHAAVRSFQPTDGTDSN
ncbi:MBL fold metallo-hydrolase [Nocardia sp. CA-120079]|uniref:MBL fold metallo-hydrolase n=1 Tax=Nocardia sp. CA-120079 TaxID=3239974 RepID=UPI003D974173